MPFYFLVAGGRSQVETGLLMTPWPAALVVVAPLAGRLADRYAAGPLCGAGLGVMTIGTLWLARLPAEAPMLAIMAPMLLCGAGFGLFQSPNNRAFMASAPLARSGACAGMMTTARLTGQTIGGLIVASTFALTGIGPAAIGTDVGKDILGGMAELFEARQIEKTAASLHRVDEAEDRVQPRPVLGRGLPRDDLAGKGFERLAGFRDEIAEQIVHLILPEPNIGA